ncbi:hypothetical protein ACFQY0_01615 [Haloferula chungangensis]|uniref:Uncharacterized protein n=1 Tax=Haloferula chungangensis TaxID=1048331 RepID=A0ABW2L2A8_9BACT
MPLETEIPMNLWILLGILLFFALLIFIGQLRLGARLKRIEQAMAEGGRKEGAQRSRAQRSEDERSADEKEQYLIFQEFLDEDPARSELPKKEQFAAFRKWRREKGLNWSSDGRSGDKPA